MTMNLLPDLARICDFMDSVQADTASLPLNNTNVLVHCDMGISRSSTVMIAYLMRTHGWDFDKTLAFVKEKRRIRPNENFVEQLKVWDEVKYDIWENDKKNGKESGKEKEQEDKTPRPAYAAYLATRAERLKAAGLTGNEPIGIRSL
jgi:hypothetical protein